MKEMTESEKLDLILAQQAEILMFINGIMAVAGPMMGGGGIKGAALRGAMPTNAKDALAALANRSA